MTFTKQTLTETLKKITADFDLRANEDNLEFLDKECRKDMEQVVAPIFGDKKIFVLHSGEINVYCQSEKDVQNVIEIAQNMGYKNIVTYVPKVSDGTQYGSKNDPKNPLAVSIKESESLVFGNHSQKFIELMDSIVAPFKEFVTYTYCYNNDYRLTFRNKEAAKTLESALNAFFEVLTSQAETLGKEALKLSVNCKQEKIDNYTVQIVMDI